MARLMTLLDLAESVAIGGEASISVGADLAQDGTETSPQVTADLREGPAIAADLAGPGPGDDDIFEISA